MEDTEWTDILKKHGIIKEETKKQEESEPKLLSNFEQKLNDIKSEDDLNDLCENDDQFIREYRNRRIAEIKANSLIPRFGDVREITASDYVQEVNNAGQHIWVVLLLYQSGIPECSQMQDIIKQLSQKHPNTKFLKSIASLCVANFPDTSVPAIFIYQNGVLIKQLIGSLTFGGKDINIKSVERVLSKTGAIITNSDNDSTNDKKCNKFYEEYDD